MGALLEPSKHAYEGRAQSSVTKLCFVFSPIFKGVRTFKKNKKRLGIKNGFYRRVSIG